MIRKQIFALCMFGLIGASMAPAVNSQEIRLEPPQLDRRGIIRSARPTRPGRMPVAGRPVPGRASQAGNLRMGVSRMGVSRVARQEPVQQSPGRSIYEGPAIQQGAAPGVPMADPGVMVEGPVMQGEIIEDGMMMGDGYVGDDCCDPCVVCPPYQLISFADMEYSIGVAGFKGPPNLGRSGSFGFEGGINWGFPLPILPLLGLSGQIGFRANISEFQGSSELVDTRDQIFLSAGISRRVDYGIQMGVVADYLNDTWYYEGTFGQVRAEVSMVGGYGNTLGFRLATQTRKDDTNVQTGLNLLGITDVNGFEPVDTYRFFYRHQWDQIRGGYVEAMAGFTGKGDGVFGTKLLIPIAERWSLTTNFTALYPQNDGMDLRYIDESWNVGMALTWYPKGLSTWSKLYHRPLFDVADNGTFLFTKN